MDVQTGLAPRAMIRAMVVQRSLLPEDGEAIGRLFTYLRGARPTMVEIMDVVSTFYGIEPREIRGPRRTATVAFARHVFCFFSYRYTRASSPVISKRLGHADHTSVLYGIQRISQLAITQPLVRDDLDLIRLRLCEKLLLRDSRGRPS